MCGKEGDHRNGVPWYCGPAMEGESEGGYRSVCSPCFTRWDRWNTAMQYHGA
jgi:hypothetical protein